MPKNHLPLLLIGALSRLGLAAAPPAITQIRANYEAVNRKISSGQFEKGAFFDGCSGADYVRWLDEKGTVRRLDRTGYGDSIPAGRTFFTSLYFDAAGRLDFALEQVTASFYKRELGQDGTYHDVHKNGHLVVERVERSEMRFYFDDQGRVLRTLTNPSTDPASTRAELEYIRTLAATPWKTLRAKANCK